MSTPRDDASSADPETSSAGAAPDEAAAPSSAPAASSAPASAAPAEKPEDDPLDPAIRAMERGDHVDARRRALVLAASDDPKLARRAQAMLDQLRVDPVILGVMGGTLALILVLAALYLGLR